MAAADAASGAEPSDARMAAGLWTTSPAEPAGGADAVDREGLPEAIDDCDPDGASTLAATPGDDDPEGDHGVGGDNGAKAADPHVRWKCRDGENGAPTAQGESAQARAPPARVLSTPTDPGA
jgi:hypothetical protein